MSEDIDVGPVLDNLQRLEEEPLDIASATAAELQQIPGMSVQIAHQIVEYRTSHPIEGLSDLQNIKGIDQGLIESIEPFVSVAGHSSRSQRSLTLRTRIVRKLIQGAAVQDGQYLGSQDRVYNRLVGRLNLLPPHQAERGASDLLKGSTVSFGILAAKDPGERNPADLLRGQIAITLPQISTRLIVGDYLVDGGQGVVFWRPTGFSKGGEATSGVARNGAGVWPSLSTGQLMFRGIGLNIEPRRFGFHFFYSDNLLDATTDSTSAITHIQSDDLHRTATELARKHQLRERAFGGRITCDAGNGLKLGLSGFHSTFDKWIVLDGPFTLHGNQSSAVGLDVLYSDGSVSVFAECGKDRSRALAGVAGLSVRVHSDLTVAFLARSFSSRYNNLHSSGFSESGDGCKNESGVYAGVTFSPTDRLRISAYADQYGFPWRTYGSLMPSQGHEYYLGAEIQVRKNARMEFQFRQKAKAETSSPAVYTVLDQSVAGSPVRTTGRATVSFEPSASVHMQNCVDISSVAGEHGMLMYQDVNVDLAQSLSVSLRLVAFQSESYASRVYEYEADLPGAYSSPALFGRGFRYYILGRYRWERALGLTVKYSQTNKEKSKESGAGIDNQLNVQLGVVL